MKMKVANTVINVFLFFIRSMKYTCDHCNVPFSSKGNIQSHMQLKHMSHRTFKCAMCKQKSKIYKEKKNARVHLKKSHFGGAGVKMTQMLRKRIDKNIIEVYDASDEQQIGNPGITFFQIKDKKLSY